MKDNAIYLERNKKTKKEKVGFHVKNVFVLILLLMLMALPSLATTLPFSIGEKYEVPQIISTIISLGILAFLIIISCKVAKNMGLVNSKNIFTKKNITFIIASFAIMQLIGYLSIFLQGGQTGREGMYAPIIQVGSAFSTFIYFSIAMPVIEEIIYRGFIMGYWFKEHPVIGSVISVLAFTMAHAPRNLITFVQYFAVSVFYAVIYQKTKRLEVTLGVHILNNLPAGIQVLLHLF